MNRIADHIITRQLWLGGYFVELVLVKNDSAFDFVLSELVMQDGEKYTLLSDDGFKQWVYLCCPEAFKMALVGTRWEHLNEQYLKSSRIVLRKDKLQLIITVSPVKAACSADGIRFEKSREYQLHYQARALALQS
jgi:hypothetical protein